MRSAESIFAWAFVAASIGACAPGVPSREPSTPAVEVQTQTVEAEAPSDSAPTAPSATAAPSTTPPPEPARGGASEDEERARAEAERRARAEAAMRERAEEKRASAERDAMQRAREAAETKHRAAPLPSETSGCMSAAAIEEVVNAKRSSVRSACWDKAESRDASVSIRVQVVVGPDGGVESAKATGSDPRIAACLESEARTWRFPARGCSQQVVVPFRFVR